ncbi:MAG: hypothetical protein WC887_00505 [Candidatus Paceibacterota bacterium]
MDQLELPKGLRRRIFASIRREEIRRARIYVVISLTTIVVSLCGVIFAGIYMVQGFYRSSFYSYFSLLFSDPDIAFSYWREFSLSLIETAPVVEIILSLVAIVSMLISIRVLVNNAKSELVPSFSH